MVRLRNVSTFLFCLSNGKNDMWVHLRNAFKFRNVHGIINTSGLVQSK